MAGGAIRGFGVWLGAGAVSLGVGAAIACGCGVANADADNSHQAAHSTSAHAAASGTATGVKPAKPASSTGRVRTGAVPATPGQAADVALGGYFVGRSNRAASTARLSVTTATAAQTFSLGSVERGIQQAIDLLVPVINNTPIRDLLNIIDPPSGPGSTVLRLPQQPVSMVFSADGTRAFILTAPPGTGGLVGTYYPPGFAVVTEINTTNQTVVGVPVVVNGAPNAIVLSDDGTRAFVTTSKSVTVLNTAHCTVVGTPLGLGGSVTLVPGTTRGYLAAYSYDNAAGKYITTMTPIDGSNGTVAGNALVLDGIPVGTVAYSLDGTRAYLTTELDPLSADDAAAVTTINTVGNTIVGQPLVIDGFPIGGLILSPDGTRASQTTEVVGDTVVAVIDTASGTIVGQPIDIPGSTGTASGISNDGIGAMFSANGTRINRITQQGSSTVLTVINAADATVVGTPVVLPGNNYLLSTAVVPDPAGPLVYILADNDVPGFITSSVATVVDSSDSTMVGTPVTLQGSINGGDPLTVSPDGTRVYQTTVLDSDTLPYTTFVYTIGTDSTLVSSPVSITGTESAVSLVLKPDGSRAYQLTRDTAGHATITVIDTATGATLSSPFTNPNLAAGLTFAPGGGLAYALTAKYDVFSPFGTRLSVFDASKI